MKKLHRTAPRFKGWTLGLDLHKKFIQYAWMDPDGDEQANDRIAATAQGLDEQHLHVAAPSRVRAIATGGEKTDANDAWWLAYLTHDRRLPHAFVATGELRELRIACRERRAVVDERADLKRRFRSHLTQLGRDAPTGVFDSQTGHRRTEQLIAQLAASQGLRATALGRLYRRIDEMNNEVPFWEDRIQQLSGSFEAVKQLDEHHRRRGPQDRPVYLAAV